METLKNGSRLAILSPIMGGWTVWVGYESPNGDSCPARWFKGFTTCGNTYKTKTRAVKEAEKFLTHNRG